MPTQRPRPRFLRGHGSNPIVHVATCAAARRATFLRPWPQADEYSPHALAVYIGVADLKPCKRCKPISTLSAWERFNR